MKLIQRIASWVSALRKATEPPFHPVSTAQANVDFSEDVCDVDYILDTYDVSEYEPNSPGYGAAIKELDRFAREGDNYAQYYLALLLSSDGPHVDRELAYIWFYVSFRGRGYSVDFVDHNKTPPYYCGPAGDFRNEAEVSDLVAKLGFEKVQELDALAEEWFARYGSKGDA